MNVKSDPEIIIFDVGQGDAILIQQDNFQILIDAGADDTLIYELPKYMPEKDRNIEAIVLTHAHDDHIQGIYTLLDNYRISAIYTTSSCFTSFDFDYTRNHYGKVLLPLASQTTLEYENIFFEMIYPIGLECHEDTNDDSVVAKVNINGVTTMLMGDAGYKAEDYLLSNDLVGQIDIIKVGHHCSRTATSNMFLREARPTLAICSCGEGNSFGHPHDETIEKFENANVQYLITYQTGNIVLKFK